MIPQRISDYPIVAERACFPANFHVLRSQEAHVTSMKTLFIEMLDIKQSEVLIIKFLQGDCQGRKSTRYQTLMLGKLTLGRFEGHDL